MGIRQRIDRSVGFFIEFYTPVFPLFSPAPPSLVDDLLAQVAGSRDLTAELINHRAANHVDTFDLGGLFDDLTRAFQHLLGDAE